MTGKTSVIRAYYRQRQHPSLLRTFLVWVTHQRQYLNILMFKDLEIIISSLPSDATPPVRHSHLPLTTKETTETTKKIIRKTSPAKETKDNVIKVQLFNSTIN